MNVNRANKVRVSGYTIYQQTNILGTLTDLLWADPQDNMGRGMSKRGTSMQFGPDVTERFCKQNNIDYIIRSHEVKEKGWERQHNGRCWTIFSGKFIQYLWCVIKMTLRRVRGKIRV